MKTFLSILIIVGLATGAWQFYNYCHGFDDKQPSSQQGAATQVDASQLPGLPPNLESALYTAQQRGAVGLRNFLRTYGKTIRDPRLASIELDYVVLISRSDLAEARRVFEKVKTRTASNSPVYSRVKDLEKTYEQ